MTLKSTLQTTGFVALLGLVTPAIALAQNAGAATTGHSPIQTQTQKPLSPSSQAETQAKMSQQPQAQVISESKLKNMLQSQGYSGISNLNETGSYYTADATRYGKEVKGLQIDAISGIVTNQQQLSADQVRILLEDKGYSDVADLNHSGHVYTANATRNGNKMNVKIDDHTGMILPQQAQT